MEQPRTEREYGELETPQERALYDRNLDEVISVKVDKETLNALDEVVAHEEWKYRAAFVRSLINSALVQRGKF